MTTLATITDADIPSLPHGCGSWIVTRNDTGAPVCEIFKPDRVKLKMFRRDKVTVHTALAYLASLNNPAR